MTEDQQREALENIGLIKNLVFETKKEMSLSGGGRIAYIWGIFSYVGAVGARLFAFKDAMMGLWWTVLTIIGVIATLVVVKTKMGSQSKGARTEYVRWFVTFWFPLLVLAYTLALFCVFLPGLSEMYITIFILLVISTGYVMLGLMFVRELLVMGALGILSTILTAVFFLEYNDIILGMLFGTGLMITGIIINRKWKA
jgi:hypothetical protein